MIEPGSAVSYLPILEINRLQEKPAAAPSIAPISLEKLERKILLNTTMLIGPGDRSAQCVQKLAGAMADAVGLTADFSLFAY